MAFSYLGFATPFTFMYRWKNRNAFHIHIALLEFSRLLKALGLECKRNSFPEQLFYTINLKNIWKILESFLQSQALLRTCFAIIIININIIRFQKLLSLRVRSNFHPPLFWHYFALDIRENATLNPIQLLIIKVVIQWFNKY